MPLTEVYLPHAQMNVKLGRVQPPPGHPKLRLGNYMSAAMPAPPPAVDYSGAAAKSLSSIYMNNRLGCCVVSGGHHVLGTMLANAGKVQVSSDEDIVHDYSAIGGYRPGWPGTDRGCNEEQALDYWTKTGFPTGDKLLGWVAIDATNATLVKQAIWLFENVMFGIAMPNDWTGRSMPRGNDFTWDVAGRANPNQGHCFVGVGYDARGVKIDTWGLLGTLTWAAVAEYAVQQQGGELYVLLSEAMLIAANKRSPNGLDEGGLVAAMIAFGANLVDNIPTAPDPTPPLA